MFTRLRKLQFFKAVESCTGGSGVHGLMSIFTDSIAFKHRLFKCNRNFEQNFAISEGQCQCPFKLNE